MTVQLNATFENPDSADFAIGSLKRSGIDFDIVRLGENGDFLGGYGSILYPFSPDGHYISSQWTCGTPDIGSRVLFGEGSVFHRDDSQYRTKLCIDLDERQLDEAFRSLRSNHGFDIFVRH